MFSLTCAMVSAGSANTSRTPKGWIVPGMWMGSRSQSDRSATEPLPHGRRRLRRLLPLDPAREREKRLARRRDDAIGLGARLRQLLERGEHEAPPRRGTLAVASEE